MATRTNHPQIPPAITTLSVAGFKSISDEQTIEIRPLTLLAGANSSGKSSMMQPLLLLKQTLEAPYDPGPLLLNGPNAKFTSVSQFWPLAFEPGQPAQFVVTVGTSGKTKIGVAFRWKKKQKRLGIDCSTYYFDEFRFELSEGTPINDVIRFLVDRFRLILKRAQVCSNSQTRHRHRPKSEGRGSCLEMVISFQGASLLAPEGFSRPLAFVST